MMSPKEPIPPAGFHSDLYDLFMSLMVVNRTQFQPKIKGFLLLVANKGLVMLVMLVI